MMGLRNLYKVFNETRRASRERATLAVVGDGPRVGELAALLGAQRDMRKAEVVLTVSGSTVSLSGKGVDDPGEILDSLRVKVKEMLVQQGKVEEQKDGMDIAIAVIDQEKKVLQYAGAHNPLYLLRKSLHVSAEEAEMEGALAGNGYHLIEFKGDRQPIGFHWEETKFTTHLVELKDRDTLYLFTDGFIDQFGGEHRKKFKAYRFKELLLSIQEESMPEQKQLLEKVFDTWKGDIEQIDDVCIIGVRI